MKDKNYKIGVMGKASRSKGIPKNLAQSAEAIGTEIANQDCVLVTGGCMGTSWWATKGASEAGGKSLWYSPACNLAEHLEPPISYPAPLENTEVIFTETSKPARNVLSIIESQAVIFVGGGIGTLNELTIAYHEGKVLGILDVEGTPKDVEGRLQKIKKGGATILKDEDPQKLVQKVIAELDKKGFGPRKEIPLTFKNKQKLQLSGIYHLPQARKPPLVIMVHGFDGTKTDKKMVEAARTLRDAGIAVFRFDFAGCGDSEGNFEETTVLKQVQDLHSAYSTVLSQGDVDSSRIAFLSYSLGTVVTSLFCKGHDIHPKTLVFWSQGFNQKKLLRLWQTESELEKWKKDGFIVQGSRRVGKAYLEENEDRDYSSVLSELKVPILLLHGERDEDVPLKFSERLAQNHEHLTLESLPGTDHKLNDYKPRQKLVERTASWFRKYLLK